MWRPWGTVEDVLRYQWLPTSGETWCGDYIFFHYVNVGPDARTAKVITEVSLPRC